MKNKFEVTPTGFLWNGEPFYLAAGDIHYFRIHPSGWRRRLELMKDFGLTAIQTYTAWSCHEPEEGKYDFSGMNDLAAFLELCQELDLKVLLRPSPYICAETEFGGLPYWLLKDRTISLRCSDPRYLNAVERYYKELCKVFVPYLCTNGGPIIMVAVENEYGVRGDDHNYIMSLKRMLEENGVDVPFFTTDPPLGSAITQGSIDGCLVGTNFRALPEEPTKAIEQLKKYHPGTPAYVGEFWAGRQSKWLQSYQKREVEPIAEGYREALNQSYVNFYMFCGGTNFGFYNGAVVDKPDDSRYFPQTVSYDTDAPVSENGVPTEKYFRLRDELDLFLGKAPRPHIAPKYETQTLEVDLTECALLFDNLDVLSTSNAVYPAPMYMEDVGQDFGYILYSTEYRRIADLPAVTLGTKGVCDYAEIYQNGKDLDFWLRDRKAPKTRAEIQTDITRFDILVENLGRTNCGVYLENNRKGLVGTLEIDLMAKHDIRTRTLPMKDLSKLNYQPLASVPRNQPVFLRGHFKAQAGVDTFLSLEGLDHGFVMINGFNIGRYLPWGPQRTLYVPGGLLKADENVIEIFELHPKTKKIRFVSEHQLEMDFHEPDWTTTAIDREGDLAYDGN